MSDVAIQQMTEREAHRLTEDIRITARNLMDAKERLLDLVRRAKECDVHVFLGYASWQAYLADTLGDEPMRLARDDRRDMVRILTDEGMSTRAIAPIVGTSHVTVSNDLGATVKNFTAAEPRASHGLDGKTRVHQPRPEPASDHEPVEPSNPPERDVKKELDIINDIRLYLKAIGSSRQIANLTPKGKQHIIDAATELINQLQRNK